VSRPLDRLRAARQIYADMLAKSVSRDESEILRMNIDALDKKIRSLESSK
jgi:hypothetical protein